jgi:hypothetical protein
VKERVKETPIPYPLSVDFLGLDVALHDPLAVGVIQRRCDRSADPGCLLQRELLLPIEPGPEGLSLDEGHHVLEQVARLPESYSGTMWGCCKRSVAGPERSASAPPAAGNPSSTAAR